LKIQFCSDLHIEMRDNDYHLNKTDADVIVLAGDIHVGLPAINFAIQESKRHNKDVIIIAGNHEFYGHDYHEMLSKMRLAASHHSLVHFLENDSVVINGTRFIGCTLWTDYLGNNPENEGIHLAYCNVKLRDHIAIRDRNVNFGTKKAQKINQESKKFLNEQLDTKFEGKTVVVTHHGPSLKCQHKNYKFNEVSAAFISDFKQLVRKADLWIYGHTHSSLDSKVGNCKLVSNQQGYPGENIPVPFKPNWIIEV
jgi:predicted phosphodiesterase